VRINHENTANISSYNLVEDHLKKSNPLRRSGGNMNSTPKAHKFVPENDKNSNSRSKSRGMSKISVKSNTSIP
jgi:hypothetical protein